MTSIKFQEPENRQDGRTVAMRHLNTLMAANYLGLSYSYLTQMRMPSYAQKGPKWLQVGRRVFYRRRDLDTWMNSKKRRK